MKFTVYIVATWLLLLSLVNIASAADFTTTVTKPVNNLGEEYFTNEVAGFTKYDPSEKVKDSPGVYSKKFTADKFNILASDLSVHDVFLDKENDDIRYKLIGLKGTGGASSLTQNCNFEPCDFYGFQVNSGTSGTKLDYEYSRQYKLDIKSSNTLTEELPRVLIHHNNLKNTFIDANKDSLTIEFQFKNTQLNTDEFFFNIAGTEGDYRQHLMLYTFKNDAGYYLGLMGFSDSVTDDQRSHTIAAWSLKDSLGLFRDGSWHDVLLDLSNKKLTIDNKALSLSSDYPQNFDDVSAQLKGDVIVGQIPTDIRRKLFPDSISDYSGELQKLSVYGVGEKSISSYPVNINKGNLNISFEMSPRTWNESETLFDISRKGENSQNALKLHLAHSADTQGNGSNTLQLDKGVHAGSLIGFMADNKSPVTVELKVEKKTKQVDLPITENFTLEADILEFSSSLKKERDDVQAGFLKCTSGFGFTFKSWSVGGDHKLLITPSSNMSEEHYNKYTFCSLHYGGYGEAEGGWGSHTGDEVLLTSTSSGTEVKVQAYSVSYQGVEKEARDKRLTDLLQCTGGLGFTYKTTDATVNNSLYTVNVDLSPSMTQAIYNRYQFCINSKSWSNNTAKKITVPVTFIGYKGSEILQADKLEFYSEIAEERTSKYWRFISCTSAYGFTGQWSHTGKNHGIAIIPSPSMSKEHFDRYNFCAHQESWSKKTVQNITVPKTFFGASTVDDDTGNQRTAYVRAGIDGKFEEWAELTKESGLLSFMQGGDFIRGDLKIPSIKYITNFKINGVAYDNTKQVVYRMPEPTLVQGAQEVWVNEGDGVTLLAPVASSKGLTVQTSSFTGASRTPVDNTLKIETIDGVEYWSSTHTEAMRPSEAGKVDWQYGTLIHEFRTTIGEAFTLDNATPYVSNETGDTYRLKTNKPVDDLLLDALTQTEPSVVPVVNNVPDGLALPTGTAVTNAYIYSPINPLTDKAKHGRDKFKGELYFTRPGRYRLSWMLDDDKYPAGITGIQQLVVEVNVFWPAVSNYHQVAETNPIPLDKDKADEYFFKEVRLTEEAQFDNSQYKRKIAAVDSIALDENQLFSFNKWTNPDESAVYRSVLLFTHLQAGGVATGDVTRENIVVRVVESRHWSNKKGVYPLIEKTVDIGAEITDVDHDRVKLGHTGCIVKSDTLKNARYNSNTYNSETLAGAIFAVNQEENLNGVSGATDGKNDLVVAWYKKSPEGVAWPNKAVRYSPQWPADTNRIVVASRLGSDGLLSATSATRQLEFDPAKYKNLTLYNQPDANKPGYNPNEEHALIKPSFYHSSKTPKPSAAFALRNDLNQENASAAGYTSKPVVLVQYQNVADGAFKMAAYNVKMTDADTEDQHGSHIVDVNGDGKIDSTDGDGKFKYTFEYPIHVGEKIVAPYPLNEVIGANSIREIAGSSDPTGASSYWEDKDGNAWVVNKGNFNISYWYPMLDSFWHPSAKVGDIVPLSLNSGGFVSDGSNYQDFNKTNNIIKSTYNSYWKAGLPALRLGETLTFEGGEEKKDAPSVPGLPSAVAWASAEVITDSQNEQQNAAKWKSDYSVRIRPVVREISVGLASTDFPEALEPATKLTANKAGKWFFEELHAGLKQRVYYDQTTGKLVLRGILNDRFAGDKLLTKSPGGYNYILQPNILTIDDLAVLAGLTGVDEKLKSAFVQLYALSVDPGLTAASLGSVHYDEANQKVLYQKGGAEIEYTVGLTRFLRDRNNRLLVTSDTNLSTSSKATERLLPNESFPAGVSAADLELVDESELPYGVTIEDVEVRLLLSRGGKIVRIKSGKGYIPASNLGAGLAVMTNTSLSSLATFTDSHVVIAENNEPSLQGAPVQLHVFKVNNRPYRGQIKTVLSDNAFDEKITLRHTGDFGANVKDLIFEWYYREADGVEQPPYIYADFSCGDTKTPAGTAGANWATFADDRALPEGYEKGQGRSELVFGKTTGKDVLVDNSFYVRYRHKNSVHGWSGWAGSGANNPCNQPDPVFKSQLVKGWVKRVTDRINEYDARVDDFSGDAPATYVSMIEQVGMPYVGDVALNDDKDVIENVGLASLYQTVLNRAKNLSISATQPSSTDGVVQALQNASSRISKFYTLLGNEAYSDALDPTIGYATSSTTYGELAPTIFSFMNQLSTLNEEELVLLRGKAGSKENDSGAAPVHNRLLWNFTNNTGEAAYALSYNISDKNSDGFINEKDAKIMYPQGHGDAWGHYLTALRGYYDLLKHKEFTWVSRAEKYEIDGITLDVDYLDERTFIEAAAYKSKVGSEIVDLTYKDLYTENPEGQWQGYKDVDSTRAWGVDGWVKRSHIGAYYDWVVGNSILTAEDTKHTGIQKIDRETVGELQDISINGNTILTKLNEVNSGLNPLGLLSDVVPFDIEPSTGESHFEQVYARAETALQSAKKVFDYASDIKHRLRQVADSQESFSEQVDQQDREYRNRLIELFGSPYEGTIGAGKTYPEGYEGPDVNFYQYIDVADLSEKNLPAQDKELIAYLDTLKSKSFKANGNVTQELFHSYFPGDFPEGFTDDLGVPGTENIKYPLTEGSYSFNAPDYWGERKNPGELQAALIDLVNADTDLRLANNSYTGLVNEIKRIERDIRSRVDLKDSEVLINGLNIASAITEGVVVGVLETGIGALDVAKEFAGDLGDGLSEAMPLVLGVSNDATSIARGNLQLTFAMAKGIAGSAQVALQAGIRIAETSREVADLATELIGMEAEQKYDVKQHLTELSDVFDSEPGLRLAVFKARETVRQAANKYRATLGKGFRLLEERIAFNKKVAAKTHGKRYQDMAFRLNRNEASQKYKAAFNMAAKYAYLAAKAYDYETNLSPKHAASAQHILTDIVKASTLGSFEEGASIGQGGLADILARLKANFDVLKTQMGFNNPQTESVPFSMRKEHFRTAEDDKWKKVLSSAYVKDIWKLPEFRTHMRPFAAESLGAQPGVAIEFSTSIESGKNFFGKALSADDHAYDASQFSTRIRSVGIWLEGYNGLGLAETSRAYLVPVGQDYMYVPNSHDLDVREWNVKDQSIPVPLPFGKSDMENVAWMPIESLDGAEGLVRRHSRLRAYNDNGSVDQSKMQSDSRLFGRSVWNSKWLLVIPGESLLASSEEGIQRLIAGKLVPGSTTERDGKGISDIKLIFSTYSYSGN